MAKKSARALRDEAVEAADAGKWKRALACYLELEEIEPNESMWPKRAAEVYRRMGKTREAVDAYSRAVDRYAHAGFAIQAIAVCKVILQLDPQHPDTLRRLTLMSDERSATPSRLPGRVAPRARRPSTLPPPQPQLPRTRTPIHLEPSAPLDSVPLGEVLAGARAHDSVRGIVVIPLDDDLSGPLSATIPLLTIEEQIVSGTDTQEFQVVSDDEPVPLVELSLSEQDAIVDTSLGDWSTEIKVALAQTPLLSALPAPALERLVDRAQVVTLAANEVLFREGEPGRTLYIVVDGEVTASTELPSHTVLARLGASSFFGEIALLTEQPRSATIRAEAACELLAIDRDAIGEVVQAYPEALPVFLRFVRDRLVDRLVRTSPLFSTLPASDRAPLAARFSFLEIEPGATIVGEGTRADGLYVLLSGRAEIHRGDQTLAKLGPGDLCGHTTLIGGQTAQASVRTLAKCLALVLPLRDFTDVIMTHPQVLEYVGDDADRRRRLIENAHIDLL